MHLPMYSHGASTHQIDWCLSSASAVIKGPPLALGSSSQPGFLGLSVHPGVSMQVLEATLRGGQATVQQMQRQPPSLRGCQFRFSKLGEEFEEEQIPHLYMFLQTFANTF